MPETTLCEAGKFDYPTLCFRLVCIVIETLHLINLTYSNNTLKS